MHLPCLVFDADYEEPPPVLSYVQFRNRQMLLAWRQRLREYEREGQRLGSARSHGFSDQSRPASYTTGPTGL